MGKTIVFQSSGLEHAQIRELTQTFGQLIEFAPGRAVAKIDRGGDAVFVKRYRRSMKPWWKRLFRKPYRSPLLNEAQMLARLQTLGFAAPQPLLYVEAHKPGFHESALVTRFLPGQPLATLDGEALLAGGRASAALLGRLHACGIVHGDCNPYNFLVADEAFILDFERACDLTVSLAQDDLKKIMLRLRALGLGEAALREVAAAYTDAAGTSGVEAATLLEAWRDETLAAKPTRWRPPQELRIESV